LIGRDFDVQALGPSTVRIRVGSRCSPPMALGLRGLHQHDNAACAVAAIHALRRSGVRVPEGAIATGLRLARWPGRLERLPGRPHAWLDAAHNPEACERLAAFLSERPRRGRRVLVFGAMRDKRLDLMLSALAPVVDDIFYAAPKMTRTAEPETLARLCPDVATRGVRDACARARRR